MVQTSRGYSNYREVRFWVAPSLRPNVCTTTILVADDQQFVRQTLCSMLSQQRSKWKIYEAENGKVALDRSGEIKPEVAVLDIVMPEMGGIEAANRIRRQTPQTKVILISSHYTPPEAATLNCLFADGAFVQKSEAGKELFPAITRLLPR
jgi:DNA-binding NarL/FixJ family response regulator